VSRPVEGVWQTETYVVGGNATPVDGVLFLTAGRWATLYFVPGEQGPWASAEAGAYRFDGTRLTFLHRLVFQGGGGRPLQIDQQSTREEECGVTLDGDRLKISFPSGNHLHLRRTGG
jgi:hypothetical protein